MSKALDAIKAVTELAADNEDLKAKYDQSTNDLHTAHDALRQSRQSNRMLESGLRTTTERLHEEYSRTHFCPPPFEVRASLDTNCDFARVEVRPERHTFVYPVTGLASYSDERIKFMADQMMESTVRSLRERVFAAFKNARDLARDEADRRYPRGARFHR